MTEIQIIESSDPAGQSEWNDFVAWSPQGSVFATSTFLKALNADYHLVVVRRAGRIAAGIPITKSSFGAHANPLYVKYLGVILEKSKGKKKSGHTAHLCRLAEPLADYCQRIRGFDYSFHPNFDYWAPFYWKGFRQQTSYTYKLSKDNKQNWLANTENAVRNEKTRGDRANLEFQHVNMVDKSGFDPWYRTLMSPYTSRRQVPLISQKKFERFCTKLFDANVLTLSCVRDLAGDMLAAAATVADHRTVYFLMNGTIPPAPHFVNRALICALIERAFDHGLDFDFEGSMIRPIARFYRDFNADLVPYSRIWKPDAFSYIRSASISAAKTALGYSR